VLGDLAGRQHGVVARWQLLQLGLSKHEIQYRVEIGRLRTVHAGVYAVGHNPLTERGHWMAAVLAGGKGAVLSHRSAARVWRIIEVERHRPEITLPHASGDGHRAMQRGIVIHRTRWLPDAHRTARYAIPVTTPARTLLDLAGAVSPVRIRRAFEAADRLALLDVEAVLRLCDRATGRKGTGRLRALVAEHREMPFTRSELERRFLRLCDRASIRRPAVNVEVEGFEVDFFWPAHRLIVELDSWSFHRDRAAFERDRGRDATLQVAGYRVLRITYRRLVDEPDLVAREIEALLGRR
jgi:very-short-patch-repair endonuclease